MISVDPGEHCYWAQWTPGGSLLACAPWTHPPDIDDIEYAVIESQVIIPKFTRKPDSIITLAHLAGAIARDFGYPNEDRVRWVKPHQWKGNTKKPTSAKQWASYAIHRMVVEALEPDELAIYIVALAELPNGERHDLADAVGIGLWELGRLPQPRTESPRRAARMAALQDTLKRQAS